MIKICFYNHFHNGDIIATRSFVIDLMKQIPARYSFAHYNHAKVIGDIKLKHITIPEFMSGGVMPYNNHTTTKFFERKGVFYINTWAGCYTPEYDKENITLIRRFEHGWDLNLITYHAMWSHIYKVVGERFGVNLNLRPNISDYMHEIDYLKFKCSYVDSFVKNNIGKRLILFSNGKVNSSQSFKTNLMESTVYKVSKLALDALIICTHRFSPAPLNVVFTEDIIPIGECDLNEISYLSTFCDSIVGRNSGPFLFTMTKQNLNNPCKKFVALGKLQEDSYPHGLSIPSSFTFIKDDIQESSIGNKVCRAIGVMDKISILTPTRGRPDKMSRFARSVASTASSPCDVEIVFGIDQDDDNSVKQAEELAGELQIKITILRLTQSPDGLNLSYLWNQCYAVSAHKIVGFFGDDVIFRTEGWDLKVRDSMMQDPFIMLACEGVHHPKSYFGGEVGWLFFTHKRIHDRIGYYMPESLRRHCMDSFWELIFKRGGAFNYRTDIVTEHLLPFVFPELADETYNRMVGLELEDYKKFGSAEMQKEMARCVGLLKSLRRKKALSLLGVVCNT